MSDHDRYDEWDAAYVLGALSPAERREFEEHLADCTHCQEAVGDLAGMPGLLATISSEDAAALIATDADDDEAPADLLPHLTDRVHRARRRRRIAVTSIVAVALAAAVTAVALVLPATLAGVGEQPTVTASLVQTRPSTLSASVELTDVKWGTRVAMDCTYGVRASVNTPGAGATYPVPVRYGLFLIDETGSADQVSSWSASPGQTVHTNGSSATPEGDIRRIELRNLDTGTVLLRRTV